METVVWERGEEKMKMMRKMGMEKNGSNYTNEVSLINSDFLIFIGPILVF